MTKPLKDSIFVLFAWFVSIFLIRLIYSKFPFGWNYVIGIGILIFIVNYSIFKLARMGKTKRMRRKIRMIIVAFLFIASAFMLILAIRYYLTGI